MLSRAGVIENLERALKQELGFGDYHKESIFYEPHWTCVERVTPHMLFLRDSDEYTRIPRAETGVRPEDGWEIEDCYILER